MTASDVINSTFRIALTLMMSQQSGRNSSKWQSHKITFLFSHNNTYKYYKNTIYMQIIIISDRIWAVELSTSVVQRFRVRFSAILNCLLWVYKGKGIPIIGHGDPRGMLMQATALGRGRVASRTLGRLYPRYSFYRRLSGPQDQSGQGGVK